MNLIQESFSNLYTQYQEKRDTVQDRLADYVSHPDDASIHQVRTAIRRLEIAYKVVPFNSRTAATDKYHRAIKEFFSDNSAIRDCDVMLEKLTEYGLKSDARLVLMLNQLRESQLIDAVNKARHLIDMEQPPLANTTADIEERFRIVMRAFVEKILYYLPLVVQDKNRIDEVHSLRKNAKKLFYLLEFDPRPATMQQIISLRSVQKLAGEIHDFDVIIAFLEAHHESDKGIADILQKEKLRRHNYYLELCTALNDPEWAMLRHLA